MIEFERQMAAIDQLAIDNTSRVLSRLKSNSFPVVIYISILFAFFVSLNVKKRNTIREIKKYFIRVTYITV